MILKTNGFILQSILTMRYIINTQLKHSYHLVRIYTTICYK